jgi:hypothetical protein
MPLSQRCKGSAERRIVDHHRVTSADSRCLNQGDSAAKIEDEPGEIWIAFRQIAGEPRDRTSTGSEMRIKLDEIVSDPFGNIVRRFADRREFRARDRAKLQVAPIVTAEIPELPHIKIARPEIAARPKNRDLTGCQTRTQPLHGDRD